MSDIYGSSGGLTEKLEHSTLLDLASIAVYVYFGYVSYTNLGYSQGDITSISADPTVIAVQLAAVLVIVNTLFLLHDKVSGSG